GEREDDAAEQPPARGAQVLRRFLHRAVDVAQRHDEVEQDEREVVQALDETTPFRPCMNGTVIPNASLRSRLTEPERPNSSCIATAPTKGGMISGSTPSVWMRSAPRKR